MKPISYSRIEIVASSAKFDSIARAVRQKINHFFGISVAAIRTREVYSIFSSISEREINRIAQAIHHPVIQRAYLGEDKSIPFHWLIAVGFKPGVTDNIATTLQEAIYDVIDRPLRKEEHVYTSREYLIQDKRLSPNQVQYIATNFIANPLIQEVRVLSHADCTFGIPVHHPVVRIESTKTVEHIAVDLNDAGLEALNQERDMALSLSEMQAIRRYFYRQPNNRSSVFTNTHPTDVELEILAQTWSEHCKHKIFSATIHYTESGNIEKIESLYRHYIQRSTKELSTELDWLVSVFTDNAGVIRFNDTVNLVYKVETHNSPSALDPYGGAMTGIVGVNRDPLGTGIGANLLVNVWGYCFASPFTSNEKIPKGLLHPRRIRDGVHLGVIDGGNQSGIPYGIGWEYFDPRFLGKPLVFCGTVGTLPCTVQKKPGHHKEIHPGDFIVMGGGRIGKDGIHGATFSSQELKDDASSQVVQIGDPITQKKLADFILEARTNRLYRFITDNGAGGLSSSIGESAVFSNGCCVDLSQAPLKYQGLSPWEILLSESQERMTFAVSPAHIDAFKKLAASRDVEVSVIGTFTDTGKFHVLYGEKTVAYLDMEFMHHGCPTMNLHATWNPPLHDDPEVSVVKNGDIGKKWCAMMERLNICSNEQKARQYDHEVKGISIIKPFVGVKNDVASDATVWSIAPTEMEGIILSYGVLPRYSDIDTYHMTASVIDLAIRRTIASGGKLGTIAAIDNFCWPDPLAGKNNPDASYKLAQLVRANKALYDYTKAYKVPCISGKDSMKNDSMKGGKKISIPPTLLFSTIAKIPDISKAVTLDLKCSGDLLYILGETKKELGGSEYYALLGYTGNTVPQVDALRAVERYDVVSRLIEEELVHAIHTPAGGGIAVSLAKMAIGGRVGMSIDLQKIKTTEDMEMEEILFSETNSRFVISLSPDKQQRFEFLCQDQPFALLGRVTKRDFISLTWGEKIVCNLKLKSLVKAYKKPLF